MSDYPLVALRVFSDAMAGIVLKVKLGSLDDAIESAVGLGTLNERDLPPVTSQACCPASRRISMTVRFQRDAQLTLCFKNNLTGTGRHNYINSTHVAHQTAK